MPTASERDWAPGPLRPLLAEGTVHVWRADLTTVSDEVLTLLSAEEHARARRLAGKRVGQLWARSHGLLRTLLGLYLQLDARTLAFTIGTHGKPDLAAPAGRPRRPVTLFFNLSHSGTTALYAVSSTTAVGVDVELLDRPRDTIALAARVFGPIEAERLAELGKASSQREFLRLWVRHEAELKCLGVGLRGAESAKRARRPWIGELELGACTAAAVAVEEQPRELRLWEWPPAGTAQLKRMV
jgi:4'-phosphopantetheinyl transferase